MTSTNPIAPGVATVPEDKAKPVRAVGPHVDRGAGRAGWPTRLVVAFICFLWVVPVLGLVVTSFRTLDDAQNSGWWTAWKHFSGFTFSNYSTAINRADLGLGLINSFAITLPAVFIPLLIAAFAAYAFTFMHFPGREFLFLSIVGLLVIPNYVAFVPILKIYADLHMAGKFPAVWLAHIGFGMSLAIYILRNYMATLPKSVIESAEIDGATHFQTFWRLILPMSVPALAAFAIFQFLWVWNDLLVALIFIGPGENAPSTVLLRNNLLGQQGQGQNLVTAGGIVTMVVPVIVFLAMQRFFVRGMTAGAVKG
jgi:alpha-glucoside transport system permease protein